MSLFLKAIVHPSEWERFLRLTSPENLNKELAKNPVYKFECLTVSPEGKEEYYRFKFAYMPDEPNLRIMGLLNIDENVRREQELAVAQQKAELENVEQNLKIIEGLASEYTSVYYIDLDTDGLTPYAMNEETETTFGSVFRSGITYSEAYKLYVDKLIFSEDKQMMLKAGSIDNIKKELDNKKTFITRYRSAGNKYSEMKFVKVGGDNEKPKSVALGFAEKDEEIRREQQIEAEQRRNFEIIEILASEYSSVYYIDLTTDELDPYTMNEETETTFGSVFRSGITYSEAYKLYVDKLIFSEDKKMMLKAGSIENIKKELDNKKTFITRYRSADNKYSEMKFVKVGGDNDEPKAVALGFAEKDEEIRHEQQVEAERQMNFDIIEILASEYSSVYYIDLDTDGLNPYTMNEETETTFGSVFRSGITYSEAYKLYVDKLIYSEDKRMMLKAGSVENIKIELKNKKTFITRYRSADNKYSEMKFVKVGGDNDEPKAVALGFAEKDEEIRHEQQVEAERQMNFDIIEILASEYTSVYYIDLTTDGLNPYTMNADTESAFGKIFRSGIHYSEAFRMYVGELVLPEDKEMMLKAGSIGNIMQELKNKKTFLTTYRDSEGHYSEMKFVKVGDEEGLPTAVALGFANKDAELRAKEEESRILQRNIDIIEILASEYSSVYYIDLTTDELDPYTMNAETESEFGQIFRSGIKYSDAFKLYVDSLVYEEDKAMMLKAGSTYNILKELENKKTFLTTYRADNNGNPRYCEMKFVKVGEEQNPSAVALGFADKDEEIRNEMLRKEKAERDMAVITGLSDDFGCVVYTGYDEDTEVHYRFDPVFEQHISGWSKITDFGERLDALRNTLIHPDDRQMFRNATRPEMVKSALKNKSVYFVNFRLLVDGEIIYYQAKFARDPQHADSKVIAGFHNVDAETKREMEALEKAETANKAKTDFLFNMSHDIRTPMNAIIGFTNMAIKHKDEPQRLKDYLEKTQTAGNLLLSLVNSILDMSRIESGRARLEEDKGDVFLSFVNIESTMQELAKTKDISLDFKVENVTDRYVFCDFTRCQRVFINLISNAIKYTNNGGWVKVRGTQIGKAENGYGLYQYTVEDNGIGMSEEFQKHVFEEFTRENNSTVSGIQGTGLGLAVCKSFVTLMSGTIECESKQGVGSKFIVTIPFRLQAGKEFYDPQKEKDLIENNAEIKALLEGKITLLVEDNEMNREIARDILEEEGLFVEEANDGKAAVKLLREKGPDYYSFVLMDIQMPIMNGYEATREIREMYPNIDIPIIALSANAFEEDRKASLEAGMNAHIAKPIDIRELLNTIKSLIQ